MIHIPDTRHIRVIAFYLLAFAAGGVIQPFLNLYLVEVGFSGSQVGILQGYTSFAIVLVTPLIGWLADRTQRHRLFLGIIVAIKGLSAPAMLLSTAWSWLAAAVSIRMITAGTQDALMNRLTIAHLKKRNQTNFGSIRLWGAFSFAFISILTGWLAQDHSIGVLFPLAGVLGILAAMCVTGFPERMAEIKLNLAKAQTFKRSSALLIIFALIFWLSLARSSFETFANIYIKSGLGASNAWIGLLGAVGSLSPILAFPLADKITARYGQQTTLATGILLSVLTCILLGLAPSALWCLPAVLLNGIAGAFYLVSIVIILSRLGAPEQAATDQMLAQLTIPGLAGMLAQPVSGWILDTMGGRILFFMCAGITLLGLCLVLLKYDLVLA